MHFYQILSRFLIWMAIFYSTVDYNFQMIIYDIKQQMISVDTFIASIRNINLL